MKKMWMALLILVVAAVLAVAGCKATRAGYASAPYKVMRSRGKFEARDYPATNRHGYRPAPCGVLSVLRHWIGIHWSSACRD